MTTEKNSILQRIEDFEKRYLMPFKLTFEMCKRMGVQRKRLQRIINGEIEPTMYECLVFEKFLVIPK